MLFVLQVDAVFCSTNLPEESIRHFLVFTRHSADFYVVLLVWPEWHILHGYQDLIYPYDIFLVDQKVLICGDYFLHVRCPFFWERFVFLTPKLIAVSVDFRNLRCGYFVLYQLGRVRSLISDDFLFLQMLRVFGGVFNHKSEGFIVLQFFHFISCGAGMIGEQLLVWVDYYCPAPFSGCFDPGLRTR